MKKLLLLVTCLVLALGLCGCGKGGSVAADPVLEPCREAKLPRGTTWYFAGRAGVPAPRSTQSSI